MAKQASPYDLNPELRVSEEEMERRLQSDLVKMSPADRAKIGEIKRQLVGGVLTPESLRRELILDFPKKGDVAVPYGEFSSIQFFMNAALHGGMVSIDWNKTKLVPSPRNDGTQVIVGIPPATIDNIINTTVESVQAKFLSEQLGYK
jgi:hypothetical protein